MWSHSLLSFFEVNLPGLCPEKFSISSGKFPRLVSLTTLPSGGHFAAMEVPGDLAADVLTFASKVEKMK